MNTRVHPTSVVDSSALLGDGVEIGAYCVIGGGVRIGDGSVLHNHVTVYPGTTLGRGNRVYPWAVLGADPQDLKYLGGPTSLEIGDGNTFREQVTVHRGTEAGGGVTTIGSGCLLMVGSHVAHDCVLEDEVVMANSTMLGGHCMVEFGAGLGGGVGVHHFCTIGTLSFVGGMSRVTRDVPPFLVVEGQPAEPRKVNTTALARRGWTQPEMDRMKDAYRLLFDESSAWTDRDAAARAMPGGAAHVSRLCDFLKRMHEGVYGRWREAEHDRRSRAGVPG